MFLVLYVGKHSDVLAAVLDKDGQIALTGGSSAFHPVYLNAQQSHSIKKLYIFFLHEYTRTHQRLLGMKKVTLQRQKSLNQVTLYKDNKVICVSFQNLCNSLRAARESKQFVPIRDACILLLF